jgi:hypothetical protein
MSASSPCTAVRCQTGVVGLWCVSIFKYASCVRGLLHAGCRCNDRNVHPGTGSVGLLPGGSVDGSLRTDRMSDGNRVCQVPYIFHDGGHPAHRPAPWCPQVASPLQPALMMTAYSACGDRNGRGHVGCWWQQSMFENPPGIARGVIPRLLSCQLRAPRLLGIRAS